jgi:outer membrane lipoprotein SlyB
MNARIATALAAAIAATALYAPAASAKCYECGTIAEIKQIEKKGESSGGGAVIGGVLGGVIGHQIGSGRGNTAATIAGAAGGAYAGNQVEKNRNAVTVYQVTVNMEEGKDRIITLSNPPKFSEGDKVTVKTVEGKVQIRKRQ